MSGKKFTRRKILESHQPGEGWCPSSTAIAVTLHVASVLPKRETRTVIVIFPICDLFQFSRMKRRCVLFFLLFVNAFCDLQRHRFRSRNIHTFLILALRKHLRTDYNLNISQRDERHSWHSYESLDLACLFQNMF